MKSKPTHLCDINMENCRLAYIDVSVDDIYYALVSIDGYQFFRQVPNICLFPIYAYLDGSCEYCNHTGSVIEADTTTISFNRLSEFSSTESVQKYISERRDRKLFCESCAEYLQQAAKNIVRSNSKYIVAQLI